MKNKIIVGGFVMVQPFFFYLMTWVRILNLLMFLFFVTPILEVNGQENVITKKNIAFIEYPGFPEAHSSWGSIGYNSVNNTVYIGVTNHHDKVGLYEYSTELREMKLKAS